MPDVPQFRIPFDFSEVEQASNEELAQRVDVLCRTPLGWLDGRPNFGLAEQAFLEGGANVLEVERQLAATLGDDAETLVEEDLSLLNQGLASINVTVGGR